MATVESTIPSLLLARIGALVLSPALPVAYPDIAFTPPTGPYLDVRYLPNSNVNLFIGNNDETQYRGLIQVTVVFPSGRGIPPVMEIAGLVADHFAKGTVLRSGSASVRIYEQPSVAPSMQDTDRVRVPVTIKYHCFSA